MTTVPVDSLLKLFLEHGADELRLASGEVPRLSRRGQPLKLTLPLTSSEMLLHLLGPLLTDEDVGRIEGGATVERQHQPEGVATGFQVTLARRASGAGIEALFRTSARPGSGAPTATAATRPAASLAPTAGSAPAAHPRPPTPGAPAIAGTTAAQVDEGAAAAPAQLVLATEGPLGSLLAQALALRASDLHLQSGAVPVVRVDGSLRPLPVPPLPPLEELLDELPGAAVGAALAGRRAWDGTADFQDRRVRVHLYRAAEGPAAALRLLPGEAPPLAALHLPAELGDLALLGSGLVIVCGPTGSGKSATLAALASEAVHRRGALLVTLEDPIEYRVLAGERGLVRQRQVGRDVPDFPSGLRDALREDPDVILVGEMRDAESVALALTAAETGHLVLASLHSRSTASAIERIVDALPGRREGEVRAQLAQSLRAVVAQRLLPRERGTGRAVALELLRMNHNVAALVREGRTAQVPSALQSGRKEGLLLLEASLADLVRSGAIARPVAVAAANDAALLAGYLDVSR